MTIQPVIVIYNQTCADSLSVGAMERQGAKPIIVDNSERDLGNRRYCRERGFDYIDMHGNRGLSKAYNAALEQARGRCDYFLWLDDDTVIPNDFLDRAAEILQGGSYGVLLPVVTTVRDGRILSPSRFKDGRTFAFSSVDEIEETATVSGINSGMMVNAGIYDRYRYDERIFLDCLDHDFIVYCINHRIDIRVIKELQLKQNYSGEEPDKRNALARHKIFAKDFRYFRRKHHYNPPVTELILLKRLITLWLRR